MKHCHGCTNGHAGSVKVCKIYGVSSKTVRDIWSGRCWARATASLKSKQLDVDMVSGKVAGDSKKSVAKTTNHGNTCQTNVSSMTLSTAVVSTINAQSEVKSTIAEDTRPIRFSNKRAFDLDMYPTSPQPVLQLHTLQDKMFGHDIVTRPLLLHGMLPPISAIFSNICPDRAFVKPNPAAWFQQDALHCIMSRRTLAM
eukprot:CAMPEP_0113688794 /NCGR_PEP_ID=MMETSP0038_2-20120614/16755_1 /TAXON_ID=2898 /ORGANISM="Cryptomonas paramecium" /LENGTH=197 /DNA_ID=CAMNT_0000609691 /DNA_START=192 /DNA_END=785 /DNA_ORIENTATION=+ /assembly_acc=CAM_ASM_000170